MSILVDSVIYICQEEGILSLLYLHVAFTTCNTTKIVAKTKTNKLSSSIFFEEFCTFVEQFIILPGNILTAEDFNFHIDNIRDPDTIKFNKILTMVSVLRCSY